MHPHTHARERPDHPALVMADTGETLTYRALDEEANRVAHLLRRNGLRTGDHVIFALENGFAFLVLAWGAHRAGLYFTPMPTRLTAGEMAYIARDCGAKAAIVSASFAQAAAGLAADVPGLAVFSADGAVPGCRPYEAALAECPTDLIADPEAGQPMLYSSGTTGFPKGIKRPLPQRPFDAPIPTLAVAGRLKPRSVYYHPAPLYHSAPLIAHLGVQARGATAVLARRFEPETALATIARYRVTHSQWVPTMFIRMLKLEEEVRARYDLSSLEEALHAAAPCPIPVKEAMIAWWGPILVEYYAGTEGIGMTMISSQEWLAHKGSVGRPLNGSLHILDEDGRELPPGETGGVYFAGGLPFAYHNAPEKTARAHSPQGYATLGDIGHLDAEGYLYLTDRKHFMIISGGVNIYPQEAESVLLTHPKIADAVVIGVPNEELGEEAKAVVELLDRTQASDALAEEILAFCRARLSIVKCPRSLDFVDALPRETTGKIFKSRVRDLYWPQSGGHGGSR
ncbi:MAG: acyl-CoA synthetase [Alphaproteobacteria bacterium]|nr:acyl-CoA synthetase [Alphaproteobacteria bacterium]